VAPVFAGRNRDVTEENIQARARGVILMAISNKFGLMVVTTGNKSEMSVGYATLYGDMNGGFNRSRSLQDQVFRLSRLRNSWKPEVRLGRTAGDHRECHRQAATAELRENQKDQDSLPPYDMLDQILERLVEREEPSRPSSPRASTATSCSRSSVCCTSPNTSGGSPRRASR